MSGDGPSASPDHALWRTRLAARPFCIHLLSSPASVAGLGYVRRHHAALDPAWSALYSSPVFLRVISLLLVFAMACLSPTTASVPPKHSTVSCCAEPPHHQSCPGCPTSSGDSLKCCSASLAVALIFSRPPVLIFPRAVLCSNNHACSFVTRRDRPLLPPPKTRQSLRIGSLASFDATSSLHLTVGQNSI